MKHLGWLIITVSILFSCQNNEKTASRISKVSLFDGQKLENNKLLIEADLNDSYVHGISIPSEKEKTLKFSFSLKNTEGNQNFYYRIYYQNKSYKYDEFVENSKQYNVKASNNFYGSWHQVGREFKTIEGLKKGEEIRISDSVIIMGNPRNEIKFYGKAVLDQMVNDSIIAGRLNLIKISPNWVEDIKAKAKKKNRTVEEQTYVDALWTLNYEKDPRFNEVLKQDTLLKGIRAQILNTPDWRESVREKAKENNKSFEEQLLEDVNWTYLNQNPDKKLFVNNRKKRNPRMGEYEFLLVVLSEKEYNQLPEAVKNIGRKDKLYKSFINPFYYFDSKVFDSPSACHFFEESLVAKTSFTGKNGVYVDPLELKNKEMADTEFGHGVGSSPKLFQQAMFEQYFHVINKDFQLKNVPFAADVIEGPYSRSEYEENKKNYPLDERAIDYTSITKVPGQTVFYNDSAQAIQLVNPGSTEQFRKENTGVMTRVGLTYGKYTAKIKFPKIINLENVWNGVTCAFWLFSEDMNDWNSRNLCSELGYMKKGDKSDSKDRYAYSTYSEIDIEIVKTSKFWPQSSYGGAEDYPIDDPENNHNLMVTTTNWDLACRDPKNFHQGILPIEYLDKTFELHRWEYGYQALTSKREYRHDKTVGDEFYYQIDWRPDEIIWRIGKSKEEMEVIGYMNSDFTKVPDNQMISIITQEFHYALWWPLAPYDQNNVPYPSKDINGYVYSVEVE